MIRRAIISLLLAAVVAACSADLAVPASAPSTVTVDPTAPPVELTIYAAASLKTVLEQVKAAYEAANPGTALTISTDSSAALEAQIEQGAPADVFLSADTTNPAKLRAGGFAAADPVAFTRNTLVIIVPEGDGGVVASPFDLARPGLKVIAAGDDVPITKYATKLIQNLAAQPAAPAAFAQAYARNIVSKEDNVRAVVAKIELGEGDAAIVYVTDAAGKVETVAITPEGANVPATYAGVVLAASRRQAAATAFLAWLTSADGQAIFASFGFLPLPA